MWTTLLIILCLGANVYSESLEELINSTSISTEVQRELTAISLTCLTPQDIETLGGNVAKLQQAAIWIIGSLHQFVETIALQELRTALNLPALPAWTVHNATMPSEQELASATTIEEYYNLIESPYEARNLEGRSNFLEPAFKASVNYLRKRIPSLPAVFKRAFEEACPVAPEVLDRKEIDSMMQLCQVINRKANEAFWKMLLNVECQKHMLPKHM